MQPPKRRPERTPDPLSQCQPSCGRTCRTPVVVGLAPIEIRVRPQRKRPVLVRSVGSNNIARMWTSASGKFQSSAKPAMTAGPWKVTRPRLWQNTNCVRGVGVAHQDPRVGADHVDVEVGGTCGVVPADAGDHCVDRRVGKGPVEVCERGLGMNGQLAPGPSASWGAPEHADQTNPRGPTGPCRTRSGRRGTAPRRRDDRDRISRPEPSRFTYSIGQVWPRDIAARQSVR